MADSSRGTSDHAVILETLRRVDRRVRLNQFLQALGLAVCVLLLFLLALRTLGLLLSVEGPSFGAILSVWLSGLVIFFTWKLTRPRTLAQAAVIADARADLKDEIKTAYWFLRLADASPWIALQARRAANTARGLVAQRLVPTVLPKNFFLALGLSGLLGILYWAPLPGPGRLPETAKAGTFPLSDEQEQQVEELRDLMQRAEALEERVIEEARSLAAEARERLEKALRELEEGEILLDAALRELQEAQNLLDEGNLDMAALEEMLQELAGDLEGGEALAELADALRSEQMREAAELLRELAEKLGRLESPEELQDLLERLQRASEADPAGLDELMAALQEAVEGLEGEDMAEAQRALQEAAEAMESLADRRDAQQLMNQAAERMEQLEQSMAQQPFPAPMRVDPSRRVARDLSELQGGEEVEGAAVALPSDEVEWQTGASEPSEPGDQPEGGPVGHASGDPLGGEARLGDPTRLDVQLEMEILEVDEEDEEPRPEDIFRQASRQQESMLEYRDVRRRSGYAAGDVMSVEQIPWRYRMLVKTYFLAIRPRQQDER